MQVQFRANDEMLGLLLPIATTIVAQAPALSLSANTKSVIPLSSQQEMDLVTLR
jgi:hypothetical protein